MAGWKVGFAGSCFSAAGLTVGRVSRGVSPEARTFSPSELMVNARVWSEKNCLNSKGRGRVRLGWLKAEEATEDRWKKLQDKGHWKSEEVNESMSWELDPK
jgi:hypothetical protein